MQPKREVVLVGERFNVERRWLARRDGGTEVRELVVHPGSVIILPLLADGRVVMIRNHRFSVERVLWELPAGTRDPNEPVELCAARELEEETGYRAASLTPLLDFYPAPGISDERMHAFVATGLTQSAQQLDATEQIDVVPLAPTEVLRMLAAREIEDAKTIAVLLFHRFLQDRHAADAI
jgi:ADP-ribose pyrophosphatase